MDLIDQLQNISSRIAKQMEHIVTEEATKNALVLPFINALGYDVFNPLEVVPEFTCDVGIKKGEKVDYAIFQDGKPIMLIECKTCGRDLDEVDYSQLVRYFHVTDARIAILSNGVVYRFFTDLDESNKMDKKPYLELDLSNINEPIVNEIKKLSRGAFDLERALSSANELKYTRELKALLAREMHEPSEEFVKFFASLVYAGRVTQSVREQFGIIIKKALHQFINDKINERLQSAMSRDDSKEQDERDDLEEGPVDESPRVETTEEEMEGFYIVKSLVRDVVDPNRITHRDTISYFGILLDDNNRKPICRLHFNRSKKYVGLFDEGKREQRVPIDSLNDIFGMEDALKETVRRYEAQ